jgi:membrane protein
MSGAATHARRQGAIGVIRDVWDRIQEDQVTHHAAALTYYTLLSLFPGLLVGVAVLGLLGQQSTVDSAARYIAEQGADEATVNAVRSSLQSAINARSGTAGLTALFGLGLALYGASGAFAAAGRALNVVLDVEEERGFVRRKLIDLGSTLFVVVLGVLALVLVFFGGKVARDLFGTLGLGDTAYDVWRIVRWPAALLVTMLAFAYVYWAAPDDRTRPFRWISPGSVTGVLVWIAASAGFFFYVSNFAKYNAVYGAFATTVVLLLWLWLTNIALLVGAELNAELDARASPEKDPVAKVVRELEDD